MRRNAFGANGASVVSVSRTCARRGRPKPRSNPPPAAPVATRKLRLSMGHLRSCLLDGCTNARVGAATADVAGHGAVDIGVARLRLCREQRARRHDLAGLAITALNHIEREPGGLDLPARRGCSHGL